MVAGEKEPEQERQVEEAVVSAEAQEQASSGLDFEEVDMAMGCMRGALENAPRGVCLGRLLYSKARGKARLTGSHLYQHFLSQRVFPPTPSPW